MITAYFSLFNLKFSANYKLSLGNTSQNTLLSNAAMCFSLAFPLAYNTVMLFDETKSKDINKEYQTGFTVFYDPITKIPILGTYYNYIVPLLIILVIILQLVFRIRREVRHRSGKDAEEEKKRLKKVEEGERVVVTEYRKEER